MVSIRLQEGEEKQEEGDECGGNGKDEEEDEDTYKKLTHVSNRRMLRELRRGRRMRTC
jgi:hypothetical protein